jgi:hypothetical protein
LNLSPLSSATLSTTDILSPSLYQYTLSHVSLSISFTSFSLPSGATTAQTSSNLMALSGLASEYGLGSSAASLIIFCNGSKSSFVIFE